MISLCEICDILKNNDFFTILMHQSPDGDTVGSAYALCRALQKHGKHAKVLCSDKISDKFDYIKKSVVSEIFADNFIISVDISDTKLLGENLSHYSNKINLCIDHHSSNVGYAENNFVNSRASATCEIIFELIKLMNIEIDKQIADSIYTGISTDTGCFKYSNVTFKTHLIAAELLEIGSKSAYINRIMFDTKTKQRLKLEKLVMETLEFYCKDKCAVINLTNDMLEKCDYKEEDTDGISSIPKRISGVEVGVTIIEKETNSFKVSIRTDGNINASNICFKFGGGGHRAAGGCKINGEFPKVKQKIIKAVFEELGNNND